MPLAVRDPTLALARGFITTGRLVLHHALREADHPPRISVTHKYSRTSQEEEWSWYPLDRRPFGNSALLWRRGCPAAALSAAVARQVRGQFLAKRNDGWKRHRGTRLVQITVGTPGDELRLCRLTCGKAAPFRRTADLNDLLGAGWKAQPSSLRRGGGKVWDRPESRRLSASRDGRAARGPSVNRYFGQLSRGTLSPWGRAVFP